MTDVPQSHPRYLSLKTRDDIVAGVRKGITSEHGLIAHGRGEAFDYLLGEKTHRFAQAAIEAAAVLLLRAKHPVISVNGNAAALVPDALVELSRLVAAPLEINIFHSSKEREQALREHMLLHGGTDILMPSTEATLDYIESNRRFVNPNGIYRADVIFVPLEDGDRCQALEKMHKQVITIDLNPMSRTSRTASITIVDNIVRAMVSINRSIIQLKSAPPEELDSLLHGYDNKQMLAQAEKAMRGRG